MKRCLVCGGKLKYGEKYCSVSCSLLAKRAQVHKRDQAKHICEHCGEEFKRRIKGGVTPRFCGIECHNAQQRVEGMRECLVCGKRLKHRGTRRKYCCREHHNLARNIKAKKSRVRFKCKWCGKAFFRQAKDVRFRSNHRFCSNECRTAWISRNGGKIVKCETCGKKLWKTDYYLRLHEHHFCSPKCMGEAKRGKYYAVRCSHCGLEFEISACRKRYHSRFYCSKGCRLAELTGTKHWIESAKHYKKMADRVRHTKEYREWRKKVLKRYKGRCVVCGSKKHVHVHHRVSLYRIFKKYGFDEEAVIAAPIVYDIRNGITLCKECHDKTHLFYELGPSSEQSESAEPGELPETA